MTQPKFEIGQPVYKWTGDYGGPGIVRNVTALPDGKVRYLVGHRIEGGTGEFLHIYAGGNLREVKSLDYLPDMRGIGRPPPREPELLDALVKAHQQADLLLAMVVTLDKKFMPSQSSIWPEFVRRAELIQKHGGTL